MNIVDTIISASYIYPVVPAQLLADHSLVIHDGKIVACLPQAEVEKQYQAEQTIKLPGHCLLPGMVNAHTHVAMSLLRGIADDLALQDWLQNEIWPREGQYANAEFVRVGSTLAMAEMLKNGITTFNDTYFFIEQTAQAAKQCGMRAVIGMTIMNVPTVWAKDEDDYLQKGWQAFEAHRHDDGIYFSLAPQSVYTVPPAMLEKIGQLSAEHDLPIHMHVQETAVEVDNYIKEHQKRPLAMLDDCGMVSERLIAVHMTQLIEDEMDLLAERGAHVVHCPQSNMKLASGYCPVPQLMDKGVNVAIGTDGAASNNNLDLLEEVRDAALLAKMMSRNPQALGASDAIAMATLNGARALGLGDTIGSLEVGKAADVIAMDCNHIAGLPGYHPLADIIYSLPSQAVSHVWVNGRAVVAEGQLLTIDEAALRHEVSDWREQLA
jgi:5-methylthioadenosine/S-adenosylhomocysteine deaminase